MVQVFSYLRPHDFGGTLKKFWKLLLSAAQASHISALLLRACFPVSAVISDAASKARDLRYSSLLRQKGGSEKSSDIEAKSSGQEMDLSYPLPV